MSDILASANKHARTGEAVGEQYKYEHGDSTAAVTAMTTTTTTTTITKKSQQQLRGDLNYC